MSYSIRVLIADDQLCPVSLPLAGAAIMLTSMKAATITPRRCAARERRREARRVQRIVCDPFARNRAARYGG